MMRLLFRAARPIQRLGAAGLCGLLLGVAGLFPANAQSNTPPTLTRQPVGGTAGTGESFRYSVTASGTEPLNYQWIFNGDNVSGATNASLLLTNLTSEQAGPYGVVVTNLAGSVVSSNATLTVQSGAPRRLGIERLAEATNAVGVPVMLRANGQEHAVSFSLNYDTNVYSNPTFATGYSNATVALDLTQPGTVGLTLTLPTNDTFRAGYRLVGGLRFDLAAGRQTMEGRLVFATNPVPIQASTTEGLALALPASVEPQHRLVAPDPQLNRQSGLFEQQLVISNPGATVMTNVNLAVVGLGSDSRTNAIRLQNGQSFLVNCPYNDCSIYVECECDCYYWDWFYGYCYDYYYCYDLDCTVDIQGTYTFTPFFQINALLPGESRRVTAEFYVTDHATVPRPKYLSYADSITLQRLPPLTSTVTPLLETTYLDGVFAVYFSTGATNRYYVQYAATLEGLSTNALTVNPPVTGNGFTMQWIDNGPPKTVTAPAEGARFYRVLETP
jgi:hypothetical protein